MLQVGMLIYGTHTLSVVHDHYDLPCRVSPLYQHAVCTTAPSLSFVGIPWQVRHPFHVGWGAS